MVGVAAGVAVGGRRLHSLRRRGYSTVMSIHMLRLPAVTAKIGLSASTIWRYEKAGKFPGRRRLGDNSVAWVAEEVDAWLRERERAGARPGFYVMSNVEWGKFIGPFDHRESWEVGRAMAELCRRGEARDLTEAEITALVKSVRQTKSITETADVVPKRA